MLHLLVWLALVLFEGLCMLWLVKVIRLRMTHEVPIALGFAVYIYECFHVFGNFPPDVVELGGDPIVEGVGIGLLIASSLVFAWCGRLMKTAGQATDAWEDTTRMVQRGPFRLIRHPVYASAALAALAMAIIRLTAFGIGLGAAAILLFSWGAYLEDGVNREKFGEVYDEYRQRTKLMIPFVM